MSEMCEMSEMSEMRIRILIRDKLQEKGLWLRKEEERVKKVDGSEP